MASAPEGLGGRIAGLRARRGLTQRELAERTGISVPFLSGIENGKRNVSSEILLRLADTLDASLDYLLRGTAPTEEEQTPVIPPELGYAAERDGWSYAETMALLRAHNAVVAHRGVAGGAGGVASRRAGKEWSADDWARLHAQFYGDG